MREPPTRQPLEKLMSRVAALAKENMTPEPYVRFMKADLDEAKKHIEELKAEDAKRQTYDSERATRIEKKVKELEARRQALGPLRPQQPGAGRFDNFKEESRPKGDKK